MYGQLSQICWIILMWECSKGENAKEMIFNEPNFCGSPLYLIPPDIVCKYSFMDGYLPRLLNAS